MRKGVLILMVLVLVLLVSAGILLWQRNHTSQITAGWKTFANPGFTIDYPGNWIVKSDTRLTGVLIQNLPEVIVAGGGPATKNGSIFQVIAYDMLKPQTIRERINSYDLTQALKQERLSQIVTMNMAGENREVWPGNGLSDWQDVFEFTFGKIDYQINYMSGSPEQFQKDMPIFQKMLKSFKFTK